MTQTQAAPAIEVRAKCETCDGTGFVAKMGPIMAGERDDQAVEVCPTCGGSRLKDHLAH
jgi:DnaJ-class molecular chaperone